MGGGADATGGLEIMMEEDGDEDEKTGGDGGIPVTLLPLLGLPSVTDGPGLAVTKGLMAAGGGDKVPGC